MSKYRELTKEERKIINTSSKFSELLFQGLGKIFQPLGVLLILMFIGTISFLIIGLIAGRHFIQGFDPIMATYGLLLIMSYFGGVVFILILLLVFFSDFFIKRLTNAMKRNQEYKVSIDSFEEIVKNTAYIRSIMRILFFIRKIFTFFREKTIIKEIDRLLKLYIDDLHDFLSSLRSDLSIRLTEQQKLLESAISETNSNLKGTSELVNISELQQARLDRQIEQFEELQRVLLKV